MSHPLGLSSSAGETLSWAFLWAAMRMSMSQMLPLDFKRFGKPTSQKGLALRQGHLMSRTFESVRIEKGGSGL